MTSLYGTDPSYDYRQTYDIKDLKGPLPKPVIQKNTLLGALIGNPQCESFSKFIISVPQFASLFNCSQADFTLFVPLSPLPQMDYYKARQFILLHSLQHSFPLQFLKGSRMMTVDSRLAGHRILVDNLDVSNPPRLNGTSHIVGQQIVGNAVIYFIDLPLSEDY